MCLYPRLLKNRKYIANEKNGGVIPNMKDSRLQWVSVGCGNCIECRKQKSREWQVRLHEEHKVHKKSYFVTLSFSPESIIQLEKICNTTFNTIGCNTIATKAVRLFLERWRKKHKKSLKHWLVTELGQNNTERIHLHGIIYSENEICEQDLESMWKYGNIWIGDYCTEKTINYIVKYITKVDKKHKLYKSIILASPGLGNSYMKTYNAKKNKYRPNETREYYTLPNGTKINLPIYYRNKIYTEEERENLWLEKLDKKETYVQGIKIDISTHKGIVKYYNILKEAQKNNISLGYGTKHWKLKDYAITFAMIN